MVGTLKEVKGHCYMIEAMCELAPRFPDLHLLLVGDGELRASLEAQVANAALDERIHFMGSRSDVADLLAASDLFVLPSLWEGLSMALLEAMATGLPIVASEVSGTVQAIVPGEHGLLIPPGEPQAIVDAIGQLLSDPDRARKMGSAAQARVNAEFSARKQADDHLALYDRTLAGQSVSRSR
jgi:glycosyltransferase involved in cell wall biosynthesis